MRKVLGRLKGAVAVAQKHAHGVVDPVGGDDVGDAVAVQVPHGHRGGARSGAERGERQTGLGERRGEPVSTRTRLLRDGQQVRPRLQGLDDLAAVRLDQHLARRSGQRQPGLQRAAGGGNLRLQLPVAQGVADRERPGAHLARAQRARDFREQTGIDLRQVGHARGNAGDDRQRLPVRAAMDAALVVQAGLGHRRVRHDAQAEVRGARRQARRQRHAEAGRRREVPAGRVRHQVRPRERRQHLRGAVEEIAVGQQHLDLEVAGVGAATVLDGEVDRDRVAGRGHVHAVRKELPVKSGSSGAEVVSLARPAYTAPSCHQGRRCPRRRIVVVVGGAADADVVDAGGRRLEAQLRVAPLLVVERQRRAVRIENTQEACQAAAGLLGVDAGVERVASLQRYGVEIDLVGNGQEVRHFRIVESAEVQRHSQIQGRGGKQGARVRAIRRPAARTTTGDAVDRASPQLALEHP